MRLWITTCMVLFLGGLGVWLNGLSEEVYADDGSLMMDTIRRGLAVREQTLDRLTMQLSSHTRSDPEYADWFAKQWAIHVGFPLEPAPAESFSRYELRQAGEAWYYSEVWGLDSKDAVAEPFTEVSVNDGQYVRLHRPAADESGRVTAETGSAEAVQFQQPVMGFMLLRRGSIPWAEAMAAPGWKWLGTEELEGHLCHLVALESQGDGEGALRVWIDAKRGFAVRRVVLHWPGAGGKMRTDARVASLEQSTEGTWLPKSVITRGYSRESGEDAYGKHLMVRETVFVAEYDDSSEALSDAAFEIIIPDGTPLYDETTGQFTRVGDATDEKGEAEPTQAGDDDDTQEEDG